MDHDKEKQEITVIGRLLSMEALLVLMGLLSLISGIFARDALRLLLGIIILSGLALLIILRRRRRRINGATKKDGSRDA
ncbi:MAG TPA: hypothetical protein PK036_06810 [Geobacteraceae bacterium]|nr:hypothetical protein [Geobacteraceae bacterium]